MPRTAITVVTDSVTGVNPVPTTGDAANDHQFPWAADAVLEVKNNHTATQDVVIITVADVDGNTVTDLTKTIPANGGVLRIGPFKPSIYRQPDGNVYVDLATATALTLGVTRTPRIPNA